MDPDEVIKMLRNDFCTRFNIDPAGIPKDQDKLLIDFLWMAYVAGYERRLAEGNTNATPVIMKTELGQFIREFPSIRAASRHVNGDPNNIIHVLKGNQNTAYGYRWSLKKKDDEENNG